MLRRRSSERRLITLTGPEPPPFTGVSNTNVFETSSAPAIPAQLRRPGTPPHSGLLLAGTMQRATRADMRRGVRANGREYVAALCAGRKPFLVLTSARLVGPAVRWAGPGLGGVAF